MKKLIPLMIALCCITACGVSGKTDPTVAKKVEKAVKNRDFVISILSVYPQMGPAIVTTGDYRITVKDGKVNGQLPFIGTSDNALVYGVDELSIYFDNCPVDIHEVKGEKDEHRLKFQALSGYDKWDVTLRIWDNGSVNINCFCRTRSNMNFSGELLFRNDEN